MVFGFLFWPVDVTIYNKRGKNFYVEYDRGKRIRKPTGEHVFRLKKKKRNINPPSYDYLAIAKNGKNHLILFSPNPNEYHPISITELEELQLKPFISPDTEQFITNELKEKNRIWKTNTFFDKYAPLITIIFVAVAVMILLQVTWSGAIEWSREMGGVVTEMTRALETMTQALEYINGSSGQINVQPPPFPV